MLEWNMKMNNVLPTLEAIFFKYSLNLSFLNAAQTTEAWIATKNVWYRLRIWK